MKLYSHKGVELHKHTDSKGTQYKLYVKDHYYPFAKLPTKVNSNSEFIRTAGITFVHEHDPNIPRVKYTCMTCGHTSMEAEALKACIVICTDCRGEMTPPVRKKRVYKEVISRKGFLRI